MKELKKTQRLSVSIVGILAILVFGFLSMSEPSLHYQSSEDEVLLQIAEMSQEVFPDEALEYIQEEDKSYLFVDVRNEYQYLQHHLGTAINIPTNLLLEKDHLEIFKKAQEDSLTVVFYGDDLLQANSAWMLIYQLGFTNTKVMLGGYNLVMDPDFDPEVMDAYLIEEPQFDFYGIMEEARNQMDNNELPEEKPAMQIIPVKRVENTIDEGGC